MDLGKNIRSVSGFLNAENLYCTATIYAGIARSNMCLPRLLISVLLQWKRLVFDFLQLQKQASKQDSAA